MFTEFVEVKSSSSSWRYFKK